MLENVAIFNLYKLDYWALRVFTFIGENQELIFSNEQKARGVERLVLDNLLDYPKLETEDVPILDIPEAELDKLNSALDSKRKAFINSLEVPNYITVSELDNLFNKMANYDGELEVKQLEFLVR
jgi:hypothetical protein